MLVGKGITFDTGGLSIKPRDNMMTMKRDMTGAGVVLAVMAALADVDCPVRVTGLLPLAENSVGGALDPARRRAARTTAAAPPRSPTPTPRAGWCSPTRWPTPSPSSSPTCSSTSPP